MTRFAFHTDPSTAPMNMVLSQLVTNEILDQRILNALVAVKREAYLSAELAKSAYVDEDLPLASGEYLLAPLTVARLLELAQVQPQDRVLVIGSESGYIANILHELAVGFVNTHESDNAQYDLIFVNGAVEQIPQALLNQLSPHGGRLVAVERFSSRPGSASGLGKILMILREADTFSQRHFSQCNAPLLSRFSAPAGFVF